MKVFEDDEDEVGNTDLFKSTKKNKGKFDDLLSGPSTNPFNPIANPFDPFGNQTNPLLAGRQSVSKPGGTGGKDDPLLNTANNDTILGSQSNDSNPLKAIDGEEPSPKKVEEAKKNRLTKLFEADSDDDD